MIERDLEQVFESAGCRGWLCVIDVDSDSLELSLGTDDLVATASVFKVPVALEACRQMSAGELDARRQVRLNTQDRTLSA